MREVAGVVWCIIRMSLMCQQSLLPVTAVEFCSIGDKEFLLAGEGPYLKVFSKKGDLLAQEELLPFRMIYGIRLASKKLYSLPAGVLLVVFGQKGFCVLEVHCKRGELKLAYQSEVIELSDWILDVSWLKYRNIQDFEVAVVTAHNAVVIYNTSRETVYHCEVNCILYSARLLGISAETLAVVSGTVFNQILLWHLKEETSSRVKVRLFLSGHEGVIFSIRFSEDQLRLVSVSDDRTIRVWQLPPEWRTLENVEQRSCSLVLYGHTARVWDARLLPQCIVSIGEDATCRVWDYRGKCLEIVEGHRGCSIWSLAVDNENSVVVTGGGDCSIRMFTLKATRECEDRCLDVGLPQIAGPDAPRSVALCGNSVLCLSDNGFLYVMNVAPSVMGWKEVHQDPAYSGYSIMAFSTSQRFLALGNLYGCIKLFRITDTGSFVVDTMWKAHTGKVFSLTWSCAMAFINILLSCGPDGQLICWNVEDGPTAVFTLSYLNLPSSKHRWISSAAVVLPHNHRGSKLDAKPMYSIIVGDRKGSLHVYKEELSPAPLENHQPDSPKLKFIDPLCSLRGVHGPNGVTSVVYHNECVFTTGRHGHCRQFSLNPDGSLTELTKFKPVKGMDWIEQLLFTDDDLLVLGFHASDMVLYSRNQNKHIVKINCGGGHRSYGFSTLNELLQNKEASAVYIKQSLVCYRTTGIHAYFTRPVIQQAFVGREAVSLEILHSDPVTGTGLIAVGGEDCDICLLLLKPSSIYHESGCASIHVLNNLQGHISSVRALTSCQSSCQQQSKLLFSGGARASLKVWLAPVEDLVSQRDLDVSLQSELYVHDNTTRPIRHKQRKRLASRPTPECRITCLSSLSLSEVCGHGTVSHYVAAGCSDGIIRQYIYDEGVRVFSPLQQLVFHARCILSLACLVCRADHSEPPQPLMEATDVFLCSAATDGRVAFWNLNQWLQPKTVDSKTHSLECSSSEDSPVTVVQLHQSGINDIAITEVGGGYYYIATVGDDNALMVAYCRVDHDAVSKVTVLDQCSELSAHSSSITGVRFLCHDMLVTTSIDQRLAVWKIVRDSIGFSVRMASCFTHSVADVSSLGLYHTSDATMILVCGIGLQCYHLNHAP